MPNINNNAYGLTVLCPIRPGGPRDSERSHASILREKLDALEVDEGSPFARVPETYLARLFVLNDVIYEGVDENKWWVPVSTAKQDVLKSRYLVFTSNFHGTCVETYLRGMWDGATSAVRDVWQHCLEFDATVHNGSTFAQYIKRCQVETTFYFDGSNDESLAEQLKGLYLKQELSKFVFENQRASAAELKQAFDDFVLRCDPESLHGPTWAPGASTLQAAVIDERPRQLTRDSDVMELRKDHGNRQEEAS